MTENADSVSRIHKRYSLTLLSPSSPYLSLVISVIVASATVAIAMFAYFKTDDKIIFHLPLAIAALLATQALDSRLLKSEYSKALHTSAFGNLLWFVTVLAGWISVPIFSKPELSPIYITEGMLLFASFRIGIFTSVFGAGVKRTWAICLIQPLAMFFAFVPADSWIPMLSDLKAISYGLIFFSLGTVWSIVTD